jgi:PAS domain S-box-containing protein
MESPNTRLSKTMRGATAKTTMIRLVICILAVLAIAAGSFAIHVQQDRLLSFALNLFLIVVLASAIRWGTGYAILLSLVSALVFSWSIRPVGHFHLSDTRVWTLLTACLVTGIVAGQLSGRARRQTINADQLRAAAMAAQQRFADLVNSVEGIVWEADAESFVFTFVSEQAERILGYPAAQWLREPTFWKDHLYPEDRDEVVKLWLNTASEKRSHDFEYRIIAADGRMLWMRELVSVVVENGRATRLRGVTVDITRRKQADEVARRSVRELRDVVNTVPAYVWSTSPEGQVDFVNDRWLQFTGLALDQACGRKWEAVLHPDDRMRVVADWRTAVKSGQATESEARVRRADGEYCWWFIRNVPLRDETGRLVKWYGTAIDIEDRKRADQALRKSEERWRSVFENSAIGVAITDLSGRFLATNHVFQAMVGYTEEELLAVNFLDLTHEDYRQANWVLITELLQGKRRQFQIEKKYRRQDGRLIWVSNNVSLVPGTERVPQFIMALSEDVTERKRAEEALQRSEASLAEAQRMTHTGSWVWNVRTDALFWSQEIFRIYGYDPEKLAHPTWDFLERVHPEDRPEVERRRRMESTQREWADSEADFRIVLPDGTIRHLHSIAHPVLDESGEITEVVGTVIDVTDRKRAEEALQRSETYLAEAQRLTHTGSWASKAGGEIYWSEENCRIWGFDPQQGAPDVESVRQRIHAEDRDQAHEHYTKAVQAGRHYDHEFRIVLPGGIVKHIHGSGHPVFSASGDLLEVVGTHVDVTERKHAEEERERLRQLEADLAHMNRVTMLGELASSLAHELNQPIAAAITSANACLRWLAHNPPDLERARAAVMRIENDGSRAAEIMQRLRAFYKTGAPPQRELVDLNEVAGEMLALLRNEATRHSISLRMELAPQLPRITADRVQLQQVLMNLMLNGIEAMTDRAGELTIRSESREDGLLLMSVTDTGVGLPGEKLDRIFNAFYTTKPQGTGMGLAISRSIIEAHGGRLWATANAERGATFHFTLPARVQQ